MGSSGRHCVWRVCAEECERTSRSEENKEDRRQSSILSGSQYVSSQQLKDCAAVCTAHYQLWPAPLQPTAAGTTVPARPVVDSGRATEADKKTHVHFFTAIVFTERKLLFRNRKSGPPPPEITDGLEETVAAQDRE